MCIRQDWKSKVGNTDNIMIKDGIININKPQRMTSHDVVRDMRRLLNIKRIGHTGTLDPMATGVLPVCIGSATRIMEYLDLDFKSYRCKLRLGMETDTQDIWGEVIRQLSSEEIQDLVSSGKLTEDSIKMAFHQFCGLIWQKPPMYSAVRVNGRRLYDYARAGESVEVKSRQIYIDRLSVDNIDMEALEVTFTVSCSKGTYIRTICQEVGISLGTGAVMTELIRLSTGNLTLADAVDLEALKAMPVEEIEQLVKPADYPLTHFGKAVLTPEMGKRFVDGWHIALKECEIVREPEFKTAEPYFPIRDEYRRAYSMYQGDTFLGVAFYNNKYKKLVADKVLYRGQDDENI